MKTCNNSIKKKKKYDFDLLLMACPAIIYFFIFHYIPMVGTILAFKDYNYSLGIFGSKWIGLKNFEFFFTSQDAFRVTRNTIGYNLIFLVLDIVLCVTLALLLFEIKRMKWLKFFETTMLFPHFISYVIVAYITYTLFNPVYGVFNNILEAVGLSEVNWYGESKYWPFILVIVKEWKSIGMGCVVYYAALMGIDDSLFEAADLDGASKWQKTWNISIPSLIPIATIMGILAVGGILRGDFGLFYQVTNDVGSLYPVTDVIDTYIYRGLRGGDIGITSAVGLFQSFVGFILVICTNKIVKIINPENSLY